MKLLDLVRHFPELLVKNSQRLNPDIKGITCNSKQVAPGFLFVAKQGSQDDGNRYSAEACRLGAAAILTDMYNPALGDVPQILSRSIRQHEGKIAHAIYGCPSHSLLMIGVTGTSGKTTTSYAIRHILQYAAISSGLIGTVEYLVGNTRFDATRTTPDAPTTHKFLHEMVQLQSDAAVMEVTSHALCQGRVEGIEFDIAVFTNLSHEHLDYHKSMKDYCSAKSKLFSSLKPLALSAKPSKPKCAVVNLDSPWLPQIMQNAVVECLTYSVTQPADLRAENICFTSNGTQFDLVFEHKKYPIQTALIGRFNVENILAAIGVGIKSGCSLQDVIAACAMFKGTPGRLEKVENPLGLAIYVDYAHKEDALKNVLESLRPCTKGRLIVVFGCGGERDREKRPHMAQVAEKFADVVIVTSDNPRREDPQAIVLEIQTGFQVRSQHRAILDRAEAITHALSQATADDIILIAGKGHEKKQEFAHQTIPFDDCQVAYKICCRMDQERRTTCN